jgi:hypothetical protein
MRYNYTLSWKPWAELLLADIWINTDDRPAVTDAANRIDFLLRTDPQTHGESRSGTRRILVVPPLTVAYEVVEQDRRVDVLSVRYRAPAAPK